MPKVMNEFDLIERYFKPLAAGFEGSLGLSDDAALLTPPEGFQLVLTKDAISEGIHFIGDEDPALIAKKLLRTNLSDLAAKGATPWMYFLALMLPKDTKPQWLERFAEGLAEDQKQFSIHLAGGDTTATQGMKSLSMTAIGTLPTGQMLRRNGAKPSDIIVVSGTLSDSALGLRILQGRANPYVVEADQEFLKDRYLLPQPRLELGLQLRGIASSCMDISDGLVQDMGHICNASGVGAAIEMEKIPLSGATKHWVMLEPELLSLALNGGDDYELLFTVPPERLHQLPKGCTASGVITRELGVNVFGKDAKQLILTKHGFQHF